MKVVCASSAASVWRTIGRAGRYISIESGAIAVRNPKTKIRPPWPEVGMRASISETNYHLRFDVDSSRKRHPICWMWSDLAPHGDPRSRDAGALLKALRRDLIDPKIAAHAGRIVKLMGDGVLWWPF